MGAINIRSEEGVTPESVLAGFSRAEQEEVRSLPQDAVPFGLSFVFFPFITSAADQSMCACTLAPELA